MKTLARVSSTPAPDAEILTAFAVQREHEYVFSHPETKLSAGQERKLRRLYALRKGRWPAAYLTGTKEFYGLEFFVTPYVLVPRPGTETLVQQTLKTVKSIRVPAPLVADIGTGSGIIAVTVKKLAPRVRMTATDASAAALSAARRNARRHGARVRFVRGDLLKPLKEPADILVANLPYLTTTELKRPELSREPRRALNGGSDGLAAFRRFFLQATAHLKPGGVMLLEIGWNQANKVTRLARTAFPGSVVRVTKDLEGWDRVLAVSTPLRPRRSGSASVRSRSGR